MTQEFSSGIHDLIRSREALFSFFMGLDGKRPDAWESYGYKRALTFEDFQ